MHNPHMHDFCWSLYRGSTPVLLQAFNRTFRAMYFIHVSRKLEQITFAGADPWMPARAGQTRWAGTTLSFFVAQATERLLQAINL